MKTVCIMDSVSRANGGIYEAERRLQRTLQSKSGIAIDIVGLRDPMTDTDLAGWWPLAPRALPLIGPRAWGYASGFEEALLQSRADLGYVAGLWKYPAMAAQRWSHATRKPLIIAPHGMLEPWAVRHSGWKKKAAGWLFQNAQLRRAACLRALSSSEVASFRAYGLKNPVCIVPNGVDLPTPTAAPAPRHPRFPADRKVLLYLGRIHNKKGLTPLVSAWAQARSAGIVWVLAIAGWDQGGHEAELKQQATELGVPWTDGERGDASSASIHFLGPQFGKDKEACYASCDAFILPSFSEGLPMVVLEAWANGKPVLMTPTCNLPEGFAAGAARRIEPTPENIAEGLRGLFGLSTDDLRAMGGKGRALAESKFDWRTVAAQMASVYEWVAGKGSRPDCVEGPGS
jgi:poly(glycerol-phosphate) alpha-glucosyltransferase